jgi:redox-sensitive bicupin YhaK (pirin superfamily)
VSNVEARPEELQCAAVAPTAGLEVLEAREVPLGGPRAMTVRRTLPQRQRSLIGAWCFADHYGPDDVGATGGMDVPPHPHCGLQTVSWLFSGEIEHRDSLGSHALIKPGELNLMTGGLGIAHSEVATPSTSVLHGAQLWVALPDRNRNAPKAFQHYAPEPTLMDGASVSVFLGSLAGTTSPVETYTPLLGAEIVPDAGARLELPLDPAYEHGVLADTEDLTLEGTTLPRGAMGYLPPGCATLTLTNDAPTPGRLLLLGGPPFDEEIVMWWNFVGRSHEDIVQAREDWMAHSERFGEVAGYAGDVTHLPAPVIPGVRIRPRSNPPSHRAR